MFCFTSYFAPTSGPDSTPLYWGGDDRELVSVIHALASASGGVNQVKVLSLLRRVPGSELQGGSWEWIIRVAQVLTIPTSTSCPTDHAGSPESGHASSYLFRVCRFREFRLTNGNGQYQNLPSASSRRRAGSCQSEGAHPMTRPH